MTAAQDPSADIAQEMLRERITLHSRALLWMPPIHAAMIVVMAFLSLSRVPARLFGCWAAAVLCVEAARAVYGRRTLQQVERIDPRRVHLRHIVAAAISGAVVGLACPLFMPYLEIAQRSLLVCILAAFPAVGVSVAMASRSVSGIYSLGVLVPTAAGWIGLYPHQAAVVVIAVLIYSSTVVLASAESERMLRRSVEIRRERDKMVLDLERSNAEVHAAVALAQREAQARSRVLASASHDLRQPLHALSAYSAVLTNDPAPETLHEVAAHVNQIVKSLGDLLHGLLDLSQLASGSYVPILQHFDLGDLMERILSEYRTAASDKGLVLKSDLEAIVVYGDALTIARITRNLLDNAIKYTEHGSVALSVRHVRGMATICIADTGSGIPVAEQARVFEEFYQVDNPARDRSRGVGLGLAIVQRLAQLIGGRVELHSQVGSGSRFEVLIPNASLAAPLLPSVRSGASAVPAGRKIYVIDDEVDIRLSMVQLLKSWQIEAHAAGDAAQARLLFDKAGRPDLLMVDLRLRDGENGARLARQLHARYGDFAVLIVTGETASPALQEARHTGWPVLSKPLHADQLRQAIDAALPASSPVFGKDAAGAIVLPATDATE